MIDDILVFRNISNIADQSDTTRGKSRAIESILLNAFCYLEFKSERGMEFRKKEALSKMIDSLQSSNEKIQNIPGNGDFTESQIESVQEDVELMELIISMHKNAVNTNNACNRYLEIVSQISYWLLKECKSQNIPIPKGYKLSKLIAKEGFVLKYPKPIELLHGEEPTFDVTE